MITYTNKYGMPDALALSVEKDEKHTAGDLSATQIIGPVRIRQLLERFDVEVDVSESLWALMGKSAHKAIEGHVKQAEVQLVAPVNGIRVSCTIDEIDGTLLRDWKMTSVWVYVFAGKSGRLDWEKQLNLYAWLCKNAEFQHIGYQEVAWKAVTITDLRACMIFRDWTKHKVGSRGYPEHPWHDGEVELWHPTMQKDYIYSRVQAHLEAESMDTEDLPVCTDEERWWNERKQEYIRCKEYCPARSVCSVAQGGA
jgi:hypothetical protein